MNEITSGMFYMLSSISLLFLIGSIFLDNKVYSILSSILSTAGFFSLGQIIINGTVGMYAVVGSAIQFQPIQNNMMHFFYFALGAISLFITIYTLREVLVSVFDTKNQTAFPEDN